MTFLGQEPGPPESPVDKPMATFTYKTFGGKEKTVQAHYVNFMPGHVAFCQDAGDDRGFIVLAEANTNVHELREME